ncbi:hypothetical protein H310_02461 [Aphanomyces invadans]|uniref:DUF4219 domain-containing protein n=1 Tax=Aphanomyces invadans TaxID=157072 RepID=A0A024UPJ1_9STRA|nr:hypothetical protein H310_02461 [Aphanomyces invadans]ETW08100.1 hypothetical protein H310_02461 [Aphanomyces invadans]|eukprot:XP_008864193.1 hypothetical protein H310_02461 [Aphanomyces invadans]
MAEKYIIDSSTKLMADGANYREWCVKTRAKINQQRLGKCLKPCTASNGKYLEGFTDEDDLVALSYIQLTIHSDHLKFVQAATTTCGTWEALRDIYESASEVNLVTLQLQMSKLEWSERLGLETFTDQFEEFEKAWMDTRVWEMYLTDLLKYEIEGPSVIVADNLDLYSSPCPRAPPVSANLWMWV